MAAGRIMPYPYPYPYPYPHPYPTNAVCACECVPVNVCLCENVSVYVCASVRAGVCVRVAVRGSQIGKTTTDCSQDQGCNVFDGLTHSTRLMVNHFLFIAYCVFNEYFVQPLEKNNGRRESNIRCM